MQTLSMIMGILGALCAVFLGPILIFSVVYFINYPSVWFVNVIEWNGKYAVEKFHIFGNEILDLRDFSSWSRSDFSRRDHYWGTKEKALKGYKFVKAKRKKIKVDVKDLEGE